MAPDALKTAFALHRAGNLAAAAEAYRIELAKRPDASAVWEYLGVALAGLEDAGAAAGAAMRRALALDPSAPGAWFNLGAMAVRNANDIAALSAFRHATTTAPERVDSWMQRAHTAIRLGHNREAMAAHREATMRAPLVSENWEQRTTLLRRAARREEAEQVVRRGLLLLPDAANLWAARSAVLYEQDRLDSAFACGRRATSSDPANANGHANLAQARYRLGDVTGALKSGSQALARRPNDPTIAFNFGLYNLTAGNLATGWNFYEARLIPTRELRSGLPAHRWSPEDGPGRNLLVPAEQGLGDEILFASCFGDLVRLQEAGRLGSVVVEVTDRLRPLLARSFPSFSFFDRLKKPDQRLQLADYSGIALAEKSNAAIMAGSLPSLFRKSPVSFPEKAAFLRPDPEAVARWRDFLSSDGTGPVIGLCWRSRAGRAFENVYYPGAGNLGPVLSLPGARFITLQYDPDETELKTLETRHGVTILRPPELDLTNDLDGVAALIAALDAVVSPQTLVLSLAGALGKPGYTMPHTINWVSLGTDRMPFFPSIRLDRRRPGEGLDWQPVMTRIAAALGKDLKLD